MSFFMLILWFAISSPFSSSALSDSLIRGSSLSMENANHVLVSQNRVFSAGFHPVGDNAYCFAVWFTAPSSITSNVIVVWMANRDQPVNGKRSGLSWLKDGNMVLRDGGKFTVWITSNGSASSSRKLQLLNTGNLVLSTSNGVSLWESFDSPTDTLLPHQILTKNAKLVSSRSQTDYSSGFYRLFFDNDNVLRLLFNGPKISSVYLPPPYVVSRQASRTTYNDNRIASLDSLGYFRSSDNLTFWSTDYGEVLFRRLTLDFDGNLRLYSREKGIENTWVVSWQAFSKPCRIHGICGPNALCSSAPNSGRSCSCLPGFKLKNATDWVYGCEPKFKMSCKTKGEMDFLQLPHVDFYGYDYDFFPNKTLQWCKDKCWNLCDCKGFQYTLSSSKRDYECYPKTKLLNGHRSMDFIGNFYLKKPKPVFYDKSTEDSKLNCLPEIRRELDRTYVRRHDNKFLKFLLWFACAMAGIEIIVGFSMWVFLFGARQDSGTMQDYLHIATGFRRFTYSELKKATQNFSNEIGRGGGGIVYKGVLVDHRVAAIKRLNEANQGEDEFLAEVSTIGKLNHMNLIDVWGYCAEGKHRLLVYEYMEHGSLAENLSSNALDSKKRFDIALGTAKGLAYLHEECLEWVLHCDVKPHNILLDSNYQPKVADFGLSKLLKRGDLNNSNFSRIRGTRGYMAPEWVFNQPITSKVDVYSYGIVVLEMVIGKSPMTTVGHNIDGGEWEAKETSLVRWEKERKRQAAKMAGWMEEIIDPKMEVKHDMTMMETLVRVALLCVEEDKDARPTMGQVVEMLLRHENSY